MDLFARVCNNMNEILKVLLPVPGFLGSGHLGSGQMGSTDIWAVKDIWAVRTFGQ